MALSLLTMAGVAAGTFAEKQLKFEAEKKKDVKEQAAIHNKLLLESYKSDLREYEKVQDIKATLAVTPPAAFADTLTRKMKFKGTAEQKKQQAANFMRKINEEMVKNPEFMTNILASFDGVKKPNAKDYMVPDEYNMMHRKAIRQENPIWKEQGAHPIIIQLSMHLKILKQCRLMWKHK